MSKNLILFGAGNNGREALKKYGVDRVAYFADNSVELQGTLVDGVEVISASRMIELHKEGFIIMVTPYINVSLIMQLEIEGIYDYLVYSCQEENYLDNLEKREKLYEYHDKRLDTYVQKASSFDLLQNIDSFKELTKDVLEYGRRSDLGLYRAKCEGEGNHYGNLHGLLKYAGLSNDARKFFPTVAHNTCMPGYRDYPFKYKSATVFSGQYYKKRIHERFPYIPVFSVGPYINYTEGIYSQEKVQEQKEKNGKTLLVFLPHSIESVSRLYNKNSFIDKVLELYGSEFEHFILCVYWADINSEVCDYVRKYGFQIMSAGYRFDPSFNSRLKSIMELSDAIVCGDIGSFIGYALFLEKPIARIDITDTRDILELELPGQDSRVIFSADYYKYKSEFYKLFDEEFKLTKEQREWTSSVTGFDQIRDQNYIRNIYTISKDIWQDCKGDRNYYEDAVKKVYQKYDDEKEIDLMYMLKTATAIF